MKILWVCNVPIPRIAENAGLNVPNICGWLIGFANELERRENIELSICFPVLGLKDRIEGQVGKIKYYGFSQPKVMGFLPAEDQVHSSRLMVSHLTQIVQDVQPDILHIFGTEYPHSLVAAKTYGKPAKTVINIQGLTSYYWMHFYEGIPYKEIKKFTISNIARGNLYQQAMKLKKRGEFETEVLQYAEHVVGRTDWDEACTRQTNSDVHYHFCNESLRDSFYTGTWTYDSCQPHRIFMSQASTPIKGLQFMIQAMPEIIQAYPDTMLYIAGNNLTNTEGIYNKLKISSFGRYISNEIKRLDLSSHIVFTGSLSEEQMKDQYLRANVFVCPSTIENSPNSLGEAMLLGVPCISSDVGGVKNLMRHEVEGYVYQSDAPYMLAYYVKKVFLDKSRAVAMGRQARSHAQKTHDRTENINRLIEIYEEIHNA